MSKAPLIWLSLFVLISISRMAFAVDHPVVTRDTARIAPERAAILCSPKESRFRIFGEATAESVSPAYRDRYLIDYNALLVTHIDDDNPSITWRAWSQRGAIRCGRYLIEFEAQFLSGNPAGMNGAYQFPKVAVSSDRFQVVGWTPFMPCEATSGEPSVATQIDGRWAPSDDETEIARTVQGCDASGPTGEPRVTKERVPSERKARASDRKQE